MSERLPFSSGEELISWAMGGANVCTLWVWFWSLWSYHVSISIRQQSSCAEVWSKQVQKKLSVAMLSYCFLSACKDCRESYLTVECYPCRFDVASGSSKNGDSEKARTSFKSLSLLEFVSLLLWMFGLFTVTVSMDSVCALHYGPIRWDI